MRYLTLAQLQTLLTSPPNEGWGNLPPIEREESPQRVNVSTLPTDRKRAVWNYLQQHEPDTAHLLISQDVQTLIQAFDAELMLPLDTVQKAICGC